MKIPQMTREEIIKIANNSGVKKFPFMVGIRGYYLNTMGKVGINDRGIYDDAIFVVGEKSFAAFQANVDASIFRKGIANLVVGVYDVCKWIHRGKYAALQIIKDVVLRDGQTKPDVGRHGINFHYGSENQTWSEGCQTLPRSVYPQFLNLVYNEMQRHHIDTIKYVLIENK